MAKKRSPPAKSTRPKSFAAVIRGRAPAVRAIAKELRAVVYEEVPDAEESFYGGRQPMAMYRTTADVCWIQPLNERCNLYFMRGPELADDESILEGTSDRQRHVKIKRIEEIEQLPVRNWLRESVALNEAAISDAMSFDDVLEKLKSTCLGLPDTKLTMTWGKPHFRVGEKIFCGCGENHGQPSIGLKMEKRESKLMMRLPGIEKAPYSRPDDGWVAINPGLFDDWQEITRFIIGSYRLIAPKRLVAELDSE